MKKVILTKGLPASGKSTWAKTMVAENRGMYKRINKDDLRAMLDISDWSPSNEKFIQNTRNQLLIQSLKEGKHVILDDTNLNPKHEIQIRELVSAYNLEHKDQVKVETKNFDVDIEECIARDLKRTASVGERVIRRMYRDYLEPKPLEAVQNEALPKCYLVDIDGTVAKMHNRGPFDWKRVGEDLPKQNVINVVKALKLSGAEIIFMSGRDGVCWPETAEWIKTHFDWQDADFQLIMRIMNDGRKDNIVKHELFEQHIKDKYYVCAILDDRQQVVDMWRKNLGLTCLQVDYGDF
jgi:predicted kinase